MELNKSHQSEEYEPENEEQIPQYSSYDEPDPETFLQEFAEKYQHSLNAISSIEEMNELRKKYNKINHSYLPVTTLSLSR